VLPYGGKESGLAMAAVDSMASALPTAPGTPPGAVAAPIQGTSKGNAPAAASSSGH
jgi:hypothetical protein